ncbi:MAG: endonuclease/exonuclease/phosphatase family protein [Chloroflexota bacterium]
MNASFNKRNVLLRLCQIYSIGIGVWFILRLIFKDGVLLFAIFNTFALYLFLPLPFVLAVVLWQRAWHVVWQLFIPIVLFLFLFRGLLYPFASAPDKFGDTNFSVMSFNILLHNKDHDAIASSIKSADADIVGLQEVTTEIAEALIPLLSEAYPYHTLSDLPSESTVAIISRYPLQDVKRYTFIPRHRALMAQVNIEQQTIDVFIVHLTANEFFKPGHPLSAFLPRITERYKIRTEEVDTISGMLASNDNPLLLLCDCNLTDTSAPYAQINHHLHDSFRDVGQGFGLTQAPGQLPFPIQRIDYIWYSSHFQTIESYVGQPAKSDHLPIISTFALK